MNDRLLQDKNTMVTEQASSSSISSMSTTSSTQSLDAVKRRLPRKSLNVSGPVQPYHPRLKNFWYPVAFSADLKDDTMVCQSLSTNYFRIWAEKMRNGGEEFPFSLQNEP